MDPISGYMIARQIPWGKLIVAGIILVLGLACLVMYWRMDTALDKAETAEKAAQLATDDAIRWKDAADERGRIIAFRNAEVEAARADLDRANQTIAEAARTAREAGAAAEAQIRTWKDKARANPDQTVPLGAIARDAVGVLLEP